MSDDSTVILLVEDDPNIVDLLRANLLARGFNVVVSRTGQCVPALVRESGADLVLLDLMLPGADGFDLCRDIRAESLVGIIVVSARRGEHDKVRALNLGADDYLTKPFGMNELQARIRAALRRAGGSSRAGPAALELGDLRIDLERREVALAGQPVHLTPKEYAMLRYLVVNAGKLITHRMLLRAVWGAEYEDARPYLHVHVGQLRRKIEPNPAQPIYLLTEPGVGYRFASQDVSAPRL